MLLIDYIRDEVDLPMRGEGYGRHIGWTTDAGKAEAAKAAGAYVVAVRSGQIGALSAGDSTDRIVGYEVSFLLGREFEESVAA